MSISELTPWPRGSRRLLPEDAQVRRCDVDDLAEPRRLVNSRLVSPIINNALIKIFLRHGKAPVEKV